MSGRKQHHIPQMMLRGFLTPSKGKAEQVIVFSKAKTYPSAIDDVAAERHFYSELANDGTKTLDDIITQYEHIFDARLKSLRNLPIGAKADASTAAEVVSHLTIRNAHLRRSMDGGLRSAIGRAIDLFCNEEILRKLMGLGGREIPASVKAAIDEKMAEDVRFAQLNLPREVVHKVATMVMKENFNRFFVENVPFMQIVLERFVTNAPEIAREGHNKALAQGMAPDGRTALLSKLDWAICSAPPEGVILPDCVALGIEEGSPAQPLILADLDKISHALMPLTADRMLVGCRAGCAPPETSQFNRDAAACSHSIFVGHRRGADLSALTDRIGERTRATVEEAIGSAFEGFRKERQLDESLNTLEAPRAPSEKSKPQEETPLAPPNHVVTFKGVADRQTAETIAATLKGIVAELCQFMPLDRLDGFTFAEDYETALLELDRGFESNVPLRPGKSDYGVSVARTPTVVRDGVVKSHVVARMWIAMGLISEDEAAQRRALHTIVQQLAHVACNQMLEEALPGFIQSRPSDNYDAFLFPYADTAWSAYFGARASAVFDPPSGQDCRTLLVSAIKAARKEILAARLAYRFDGNLDRLLQIALPHVGAIIGFSGMLLGHYDGLNQPALDEELEKALDELGVRAWIDLFREELALAWDRRGLWSSADEFLVLNRHVERLLWQFGMYPWKTPEGGIRVEVPLHTDGNQLTGIRPALRLVWRRLAERIRRLMRKR